MKKTLKFFVMAFAALAFMGCPNGNKGNESNLTGLSFKPTEVSMMVGDTVRLVLLVTPEEATIPEDVVFESSDTSVVQIVDNRVNIAAVGVGSANVTATYGDLKAVCSVVVDYYEAFWAPSSTIYYFPNTMSENPVSDTIIQYETAKATYDCQLYTVELCIPSAIDAVSYGEPGLGHFIFATATVPFIVNSTSGEFIGEPWDVLFGIVPEDKVYSTEFGASAGSLDPAIIGPVWQSYFEAVAAGEKPSFDSETYYQGAKGVSLRPAMITDGSILSYPWFDAIVTAGYVQAVQDAETGELVADYKLNVAWCSGFSATGLAINEEATGYDNAIAQPYALDLIPYSYESGILGKPAGMPQKKAQSKKSTKGMINHGAPVKLVPVKNIASK